MLTISIAAASLVSFGGIKLKDALDDIQDGINSIKIENKDLKMGL